MTTYAPTILALITLLFLSTNGRSAQSPDVPPTDSGPQSTDAADLQELLDRHNTLVPQIEQYWRQGNVVQAYEGLQELLVLYREIYPAEDYPKGHENIVRCYRDLCRLSDRLGNAKALLRYSQEGLAMCRQLFGQAEYPYGHLNTAGMLANVGHGWLKMGAPAKARQSLTDALKISDSLKRHGLDSFDEESVVSLHLSISATYFDEGAFPESVRFARTALHLCTTSTAMPSDLERLELRGQCLSRLGRALMRFGDYRRARTSLTQAYDANLQIFLTRRTPESHLTLIDSHIDLGTLCRLESDLPAAKRQLTKALEEMSQMRIERAGYHERLLNIAEQFVRIAHINRHEYLSVFSTWLFRRRSSSNCVYPPAMFVSSPEETNGIDCWCTGKVILPSPQELVERLAGIATKVHHPLEGPQGLYVGWTLQNTGEYRKAYECFARTLAAARRLYSQVVYPNGHPSLAAAIHHTATQLWVLGETQRAAGLYREAMLMCERLFPECDYPRGHRLLMTAYSAWGNVLQREGDVAGAAEYFSKAHHIAVAQFPAADYPRGHDELAMIWQDLGRLERDRGRYDAALDLFQRALTSYHTRYDTAFPNGHLLVALTLSELGRTHAAAGRMDEAERYLEQSLIMRRQLFPAQEYPQGHPNLATALRDLGRLYMWQDRHDEAFELVSQSAVMEQSVAESFVGGASESLLLNLAARRFESLDSLLDAWCETERPASEAYQYVWRRRGFVPRLIAKRHQTLRCCNDLGHSEEHEEYLDVRSQISRALLASASGDDQSAVVREQVIRGLNARKEALEMTLTRSLADEPSVEKTIGQSPELLSHELPPRCVLVDFVRFRRESSKLSAGPNATGPAELLAFVIAHERPVECVRLGDARPIETLAQQWHESVSEGRASAAGQQLRELVWDPVCRRFSGSIEQVYLATDGALSLLPWNALPLPGGKRLLIEDYSIATVPHGAFLLDALARSPAADRSAGTVLAVGDLDFGAPHEDGREGSFGLKDVIWRPLRGSQVEMECVTRAAGNRECVKLTGLDATPDVVLTALSSCRWAHFATHGFFLDESLRHTLRLVDGENSGATLKRNRSRNSVLQRNPFLRSGLALSNANRLGAVDQFHLPVDVEGILTAESIAAVDCSNLELVVLSACETGRGDVVHGDGVFGLQTAFHVAGARNVIASLWKVDDRATAELMSLFYQRLWGDHLTPAAALRTAQLELLERRRTRSMRTRGLDLSAPVPLPKNAVPEVDRPTLARHWAAFTLSGPGF